MNTSSSDRCTRISPSAVLDDRLHGKDLEWARDHLLRCESCRERVEDFREMMMRVGRLPSAPIGAVAMDQAFAASVPERIRAGASPARIFDLQPSPIDVAPEPILDLPPQPVRPEVTNVRDLLSDLEREIFRDEPQQDHPTAMTPTAGATTLPAGQPVELVAAGEAAIPAEPMLLTPAPPEILGPDLREVPLDSRSAPPAMPQEDLFDVARIDALPPPERVAEQEEPTVPAFVAASGPVPDAAAFMETPAWTDDAGSETAIADAPATPRPPRHPDTVMRLAVGLGAAACVLLAAFLYEGGLLSRGTHKTSATGPVAAATATARSLPAASAPPSAIVSPSPPLAPVLFRLGNGATGGTVYRIRPGTAVAGYTRLVFDIRNSGLPAMVITQPDALHIAITFRGTSGVGVPVKGIRSFQVAAVEPAVQQGPDLVITVDLARPDRVTAFTLPAAGAYSSRLVVDLHTS
jgi:hypothetical protein